MDVEYSFPLSCRNRSISNEDDVVTRSEARFASQPMELVRFQRLTVALTLSMIELKEIESLGTLVQVDRGDLGDRS